MGFQSQLPDLISDFGAALQQRKKYSNSKTESAKEKILSEIHALNSLKGQGYSDNQINLVAARLIKRRPFEIDESPTLSSESKAGNSKHPKPIKGTVGEPDRNVNERILAEGGFKYKKHGYDRAAQGHEDLVASTIKHLNSRNPFGFKFTLKPANIIFSPAKALVSFAIRAAMTTKENKKVLVTDPAWVSYVPMIETFYGDPVLLPLDEDTFLPDKEFFSVLEKNTDACALIINSPSNPVGNVFPPKILEKIAETYDNPHGTIISDEVYHTLVYDEDCEHTSMAVFDPIRTVVIDSFSKSHAAPGLRGGYAVSGDTSFIGHMKKINSQNSGGMAVVVQKALKVAFDEDVLNEIKDTDFKEFKARRDVICSGLLFLNTLDTNYRVKVVYPTGAFYAFVKFYHKDPAGKETPFTKDNIDALQDELTSDKYGVYTVEGYHFGDRGKSCLRISYGSLKQDELVDLVVRVANCFIERSGRKRGEVTEAEVRKFIAEYNNGQHKEIKNKYLIKPN